MYLPTGQIVRSLKQLGEVHPFHGITFIACKKAELPISTTKPFRMNAVTKKHMEKYHRIAPESGYFYQPFRSNASDRFWVVPNYPSGSLRRINTEIFARAFVHIPNDIIWAWSDDYIIEIKNKLHRGKKIPAYALCVWLYREIDLPECEPQRLVDRFFRDYKINSDERENLFDLSLPDYAVLPHVPIATTWAKLKEFLPNPPDAKPEHGGTLGYLRVQGTGPMPSMELEPAERLTIVAGDNGLGKTFLLDCAWWALTGTWASVPAAPRSDSAPDGVSIEFSIRDTSGSAPRGEIVEYDWSSLRWPEHSKQRTIAGLVVYACVDGSYAVWDPVSDSGASTYSRTEVWDGVLEGDRKIEGLVRDWRNWQSSSNQSTFDTFKKVLSGLSPSDLGTLSPGPMTRVAHDRREIPTIRHRYGEVPIVYASAAVKRVLSLAYLMVWAWNEHRIHCDMAKRSPERCMIILIDEIEAHLHPRWQRQLLPALVSVVQLLAKEIEVQLIVSTHSPLILASSEELFDDHGDSLLHLRLDGDDISLQKVEYIKYGRVDRWLTSQVFGLVHSRSKRAETAIEDAKRAQTNQRDVEREAIREISEQLRMSLPDDDEFWPRWISFAERYGVEL